MPLYGQEQDRRRLNLQSYSDVAENLERIREEVAEIMDHIYMYESSEDTVTNDVTDDIHRIAKDIDDSLGEAWAYTKQ